jgi:protein involved in polysaccharide export with SLBB domain
MTVDDATNYINTELSKYLINYDLSLQLLRARHISVYLLGQVRQPGTYVAIAGTTALSLIQTAGTLVTNPVTTNINEPQVMHPYFRALTSGAGRRVEVWRNNEKVGELDLARMAIGGHSEENIILQDGDALFVPQNSRPVIVRGGIARPGTYEIADGETVLDLIAQAGGYRSMMMLAPVQVERPSPTGSPAAASIIDLDLGNPSFDPASFTFQPGDILRVPEVKNQVYVLGAVWAPKAVDYHEGWNALDYIAAANGMVIPTDMTAIRIISFPLTEDQTEITFNFKNLVMGRPVESVPIEPGDLIFVPWKNQPFYGVGITNAISVILGQAAGIARLIHDLQD